jgi:hypothetical protein
MFFAWIFHLTDMTSDLLYLITTPFYSGWLLAFGIIFFILPIIAAIGIAIFNKNVSAFFTVYLDLTPANFDPTKKGAEIDGHILYKVMAKFLIFVCLEDAPQVII